MTVSHKKRSTGKTGGPHHHHTNISPLPPVPYSAAASLSVSTQTGGSTVTPAHHLDPRFMGEDQRQWPETLQSSEAERSDLVSGKSNHSWYKKIVDITHREKKIEKSLPRYYGQMPYVDGLTDHAKNLKYGERIDAKQEEENLLKLEDMQELHIGRKNSGPENSLISKDELNLSKLKTGMKVYESFRCWIEDQVAEQFMKLEPETVDTAIEGQTPFARGGFGDVYRVTIAGTDLALKVPRSCNELEEEAAFHKEVMILKRINHPNIVALRGACLERFVLAYEYLRGGTLEDLLSAGMTTSFSWKKRVLVGYQICSALVFLHATKPVPIAHGDLKPSNVLLDEVQCAKLADFGISRHLCGSTLSGTPGHLTDNPKGSSSYMDPDFSETKILTPQSDIYALGIILLELVTGRGALGLREFVSNHLERLDKMDRNRRERDGMQVQSS